MTNIKRKLRQRIEKVDIIVVLFVKMWIIVIMKH